MQVSVLKDSSIGLGGSSSSEESDSIKHAPSMDIFGACNSD